MRNRNNRIVFYMNDEEAKNLNANVKKCGLSRDAYLRQIALGTVPKELPDINFFEFIKELKVIGRNLNQVAVKAHTLGFIDEVMYRENYRNLQNTIGEMIGLMYQD